jgi:hypothetical protein
MWDPIKYSKINTPSVSIYKNLFDKTRVLRKFVFSCLPLIMIPTYKKELNVIQKIM